MPVSKYWNKSYGCSITNGPDTLSVSKGGGSDWSYVTMVINGSLDAKITLRSREAAEQLRFMLGQLLDERNE